MKRYHIITVKLDSGTEFWAKVGGKDIDNFIAWIDRLPGVKSYEETKAVSRISPHTNKKTKIALARIAAGLTQQEFADKMGVCFQQVQRWEYGTFKTKTAVLMRMGEVLGVDWTTLIEDNN